MMTSQSFATTTIDRPSTQIVYHKSMSIIQNIKTLSTVYQTYKFALIDPFTDTRMNMYDYFCL